MKIVGLLALAFFGLSFLAVVLSNGNGNAERYQKREAIEDACEKMMADSALGNERRMTREMCDRMKARNK